MRPKPITAAEAAAQYALSRPIPSAPDLEAGVIGAILTEREAFRTVSDLLCEEDFYEPKFAAAFAACRALDIENEPIDLLTVAAKIKAMGKEPTCLVEASNTVASAANLEYHARILLQFSIRRGLIRTGGEQIKAAHEDGADVFEVLQQAETNLLRLSRVRGQQHSISEVSASFLSELEKRAERFKQGIVAIPTGFKAIDRFSGGSHPGDLEIIAARPGMGKTGYAISRTLAAARAGTPVLFFSLEMRRDQIFARMVSYLSGVDSKKYRTGDLDDIDWHKTAEAANELSHLPVFIEDGPLNEMEFSAKVRRAVQKHNVGLVVVDYLQLMGNASTNRNANRNDDVSAISRRLKLTGIEMNIPVLALSQLSRNVEQRGGSKRPQLSDLRDSGAIEQDADIVTFLYRPEYYGIMENEMGQGVAGVCEVIRAKNRHGGTGTHYVKFEAEAAVFAELPSDHQLSFEATTGAPAPRSVPDLPAFEPNARIEANREFEDVPF